MKIVYGVCGEGQGHAVRSKPVIEHLMKEHDVRVVCGGKAYTYLSKFFDPIRVSYLGIDYRDNTVNLSGTFFLNVRKSLNLSASFVKTVTLCRKFKPDLIISDFEPLTAYASYVSRVPLISIDNNHIARCTETTFSNKYTLDYLRLRTVIKMIMPAASHYLVTTFFNAPVTDSKTDLVPPILREEIRQLKPSKGTHIVVYQTSKSYKKLFPVLRKIKEKFVVYGFDIEKKEKNLVFKKRNDSEFFKDLASCKAVITNGGFTLVSEALYLGKPILSVPVKQQFEQIINALYVQRLGYGFMHERLNEQRIKNFLEKINTFDRKIRKYNREDNTKLFSKLDDLIKRFK